MPLVVGGVLMFRPPSGHTVIVSQKKHEVKLAVRRPHQKTLEVKQTLRHSWRIMTRLVRRQQSMGGAALDIEYTLF